MDKTTRYEVVEGTRVSPGAVVATFPAGKAYRCGGPATACLRFFDTLKRRQPGRTLFFRKVSA
jgi:hypothetical protein